MLDQHAGHSGRAALNEEQYKQVCEACDRVLWAPDSDLERMAIPWLHVIREHPSFLKDYEDLFDDFGQASLKKKLRYQLGWARQLWKALRSSGRAWFGQQVFQQAADILFVSHLLNTSQAGGETDFYFGSLPGRLHAAGYRVVIALIDHTGAADEKLMNRWGQGSIPHVILSGSIDLNEEWTLYKRLKKEAARLAENSRLQTPGLLKRVFARASLEALSGSTRTTLRMYYQVSEIVARIKPKVMIATYEGHAWERIAFAAARAVYPSTVCIGYQHAAIFKLQHSARRKLQPHFNPDQLFAAGEVSKKQLENSPGLGGIQVRVLGSHRAGSGLENTSAHKSHICLVLPEGIVSECHLLFEFSISCAIHCPSVHFVWRLHPLVKFDSLLANNPAFTKLPKNVELSTVSIEEDIASATHVLYRGSTAIVKAVCANVQPIYLELPGEMTIDPLYQLGSWRERVKNPAEFSSVVHRPPAGAGALQDQISAVRYCENFYTPIDSSVVVDILQLQGRN